MPYPAISRHDARTYLNALKSDVEAELPAVQTVEGGEDADWDSLASDLFAKLAAMASGEPVKKRADARGGAFEIAAGPLVHKALPRHQALADPGFWTWLTLLHGSDIVNWRYENDPNSENFGAGSPGENLFFRLWLRAEVAHSPGRPDPYELTGVGDIDFWRSHIFRQSYADARTFARALLNFQFPVGTGRKPRLSIDEIRALAKHLKRARTNLMFEVMDAERAVAFIETEWARIGSPT
jgi:hypothetical protein